MRIEKLIKKKALPSFCTSNLDVLKTAIYFCKKKKINAILTAHNLEDQVETFFIRLSRGSGLDGLSSMKKINKIQSKGN